MASNERSPLLPRASQSVSQGGSWKKETPVSPALRRRSSRRNGSPQGIPAKTQQQVADDSSDDSDKDSDEEDDEEYADDAATRAAYGGAALHSHHLTMGRAQRAVAEPTPLSYASDSSLSTSLGLGLVKRKPRWSGFRAKMSTLTTTMEKATSDVPGVSRQTTRRNRRYRTAADFDSPPRHRRPSQLHLQLEPPTDQPAMARVAAYCTSEQISVFKLLKWLDRVVAKDDSKAGVHLRGWKNKMYMGVVHASYQPRKQSNDDHEEDHDVAVLLQRKDAFYFATGCCVFWGLTREEEALHIQALAAFSTARITEIEAEDMEFTYGDASRIANDAIILRSASVEEKLAISFAMSQSAKLDVFEERVEDRIRTTKHIPFNLATTGSIQYSHTDISKLIGQLFMELADVNLHSDILDEPDFLWEDDEFEPLYKKMTKYLDVQNRVKILNKRLDILRELVEVLNQELTQQHGTKLEMIIIWLLVVEVVISLGWNILIKDILGFFNRP